MKNNSMKSKTKKSKQNNSKTRKNKVKRNIRFVGGLIADNNLVKLSYNNNPIKCFICGSSDFQKRNSTMNKSKTNQVLFSFFVSDNSSINDISLYSYFCNECGYAFIVRDPKTKENGTYNNLIVSNP